MDIDTGDVLTVANVTTRKENASFIVDYLFDNRLYNMTVMATSIKNSITSAIRLSKYNILHQEGETTAVLIIGTHDVMIISVTEVENRVNLGVQFFEGSTSRGALFLLFLLVELWK